jgi:hypothetical protein
MTTSWVHGDAWAQVWESVAVEQDVVKLAEISLSSNASSINIVRDDFDNYNFIKIVCRGQITVNASGHIVARFNDDSGSNYTWGNLGAASSGTYGGYGTNVTYMYIMGTGAAGSYNFCFVHYIIPKTGFLRYGYAFSHCGGIDIEYRIGAWTNTSSVMTKISYLFNVTGTFNAGTKLVVYAYK